jgi:hypothetical protein
VVSFASPNLVDLKHESRFDAMTLEKLQPEAAVRSLIPDVAVTGASVH